MELISYEQFGRLRLRDFLPPGTDIEENTGWEWMGTDWFNEGIGFTSFSRHVNTPDQTGGLEINFEELPAENIEHLLNAIGLPLEPGMTAQEVLSALGEPRHTRGRASDRKNFEFHLGSAHPYEVSCTVMNDQEGLIYVSVVRQDLIPSEA